MARWTFLFLFLVTTAAAQDRYVIHSIEVSGSGSVPAEIIRAETTLPAGR
jgi:hypothetical protein